MPDLPEKIVQQFEKNSETMRELKKQTADIDLQKLVNTFKDYDITSFEVTLSYTYTFILFWVRMSQFINGELIESWLPEKEIDFPMPEWAKRDIYIEGVNPYMRLINQKLQSIKSYKQWPEKIKQPEQDW